MTKSKLKKTEKVTKVADAKKSLKKQFKVNTKIVFADDGEVSASLMYYFQTCFGDCSCVITHVQQNPLRLELPQRSSCCGKLCALLIFLQTNG